MRQRLRSGRRFGFCACVACGALVGLLLLRGVVQVTWKLLRLPFLLPKVVVGKDTYDPAAGNEQSPAIVHHLSATEEIPEEWLFPYQSTKGVHLRYGEGAYELLLADRYNTHSHISFCLQ